MLSVGCFSALVWRHVDAASMWCSVSQRHMVKYCGHICWSHVSLTLTYQYYYYVTEGQSSWRGWGLSAVTCWYKSIAITLTNATFSVLSCPFISCLLSFFVCQCYCIPAYLSLEFVLASMWEFACVYNFTESRGWMKTKGWIEEPVAMGHFLGVRLILCGNQPGVM